MIANHVQVVSQTEVVSMLRTVIGSFLALFLLARAGAGAAPARASVPSHTLAIDVRSAPLGSAIAQVAASGESPMRVETALADRRVTLSAPKTDVAGFQHALATLFRARWRAGGT